MPAGRRTQIGQGCLLCQAVFIRVTELITSGEREEGKRQLPKTLLKKERERERGEKKEQSPGERGGNDKSVAVSVRDEKQRLQE